MAAEQAGEGLRVPRWLLLGALAMLVLTIAMMWRGQDRLAEARRVVLVFERSTDLPAEELMACLDRQGSLGLASERGSTWIAVKGLPDTRRAVNAARPIHVDVVERDVSRTVRLFTRQGRALRPSERAVLNQCVPPQEP